MKSKLVLGFIILVIIVSCTAFFLKSQLPIPSDTIVGLYHPFRDLYAVTNPNGLPYKNFLITDPIRQIIPWKSLAVDLIQHAQLPLWNPYQMSGVPLLANFQSSPFYFLNILLFFQPFKYSWSIFIVLQLFLAGVFMYWYLRSLSLNPLATAFGVVSYIFSGFFVAWFEWGTVVQTALWMPLILLAIDKILRFGSLNEDSKVKNQKSHSRRSGQAKFNLKNQKFLSWCFVFLFAITASFFAGHLQTFFYSSVLSLVYFFLRWFQSGKKIKLLYTFLILAILFLILTAVQWIPTLQFILRSSRSLDQSPLTQSGWFLPWQHLAQFIAPDFFGNVTTLNYWGTWNYGELVGYIGVIGLLFVIFALIFRHDKKTRFFAGVAVIAFLGMLASPLSALPYNLHIPFLSTAQPTRLMMLVDFAFSALVTLGADYFFRFASGTKKLLFIFLSMAIVGIGLLFLWSIVLSHGIIVHISAANIAVAKHNLILPSLVFAIAAVLLGAASVVKKSNLTIALFIAVLLIQSFDMVRFFQKFEPFTPQKYFFPDTKITLFLQQHAGFDRIAATDNRIFPPNFSTEYRLQSIEGYDPLYLQSYAEFISASERGTPDIRAPFGFNRIITPRNLASPLFDLLSVKYVLSFEDLQSAGYKKVLQEGQTKVFQNTQQLPRAFFVKKVENFNTSQSQINAMFTINHRNTAITQQFKNMSFSTGTVHIQQYSANSVVIKTNNHQTGFLVLLDVYYPTWHAYIDGVQTQVYKTDYTFRGVVVPAGDHTVEFKDSLL